MSVFTWRADFGASREIIPVVKVIKFGDAYEQRQASGINRQPRKFSLTFKRERAEINDIDAFLSARGAVDSFSYTHPGQSAGVFVCRSWSRTTETVSTDGLTATFEEVYE